MGSRCILQLRSGSCKWTVPFSVSSADRVGEGSWAVCGSGPCPILNHGTSQLVSFCLQSYIQRPFGLSRVSVLLHAHQARANTHTIMSPTQHETKAKMRHLPCRELALDVVDEDEDAASSLSRGRWDRLLRVQICSHEDCHRFVRARKRPIPVHTLCHEHALAVYTAVSKMVTDWCTEVSPRGMSEASSPASNLTPRVPVEQTRPVKQIHHKSLGERSCQEQAQRSASRQQHHQQTGQRRAIKQPSQNRIPRVPITTQPPSRVGIFNCD